MKRSRKINKPGLNNRHKKLSGYLKGAYTRFLKIRGEPRQIAYGLALGIMVGMTPFLGVHTVMAIFLAAVWKWNKIAAVVGVFITNPFTAPFIYPVNYMVGRFVLGVSNIPNPEKFLSVDAVLKLIKNSPLILVDLTVGGIILGLPIAIAAYWVSFFAIENYRKKIKPRLHIRRDRKVGAKSRSEKKKPGKKGAT